MNNLPRLGLFAFVLPWALASVACAPRTIAVAPDRTHAIEVVGVGEVSAPPDLGRVRLGVEERAVSAQEAMQRANARMDAITKALKAQGVESRDLQTTDLSMYFERDPNYPMPMPPREVMRPAGEQGEAPASKVDKPSPESVDGVYVVRNTVIVSVRKLDRIGEVIGAAMNAGANQMHGFELTIEDPAPLRNDARKKAVAQAIEKASQLAKESGVKLGSVIEVREVGGVAPMPQMANKRSMDMVEASVPVEQGELSLSQEVQVVFEIVD